MINFDTYQSHSARPMMDAITPEITDINPPVYYFVCKGGVSHILLQCALIFRLFLKD